MRDSQRSKLYRSEHCLKEFEQKFSSFDETAKYARKILASKWFLKNFPLAISLQISGVKLELGSERRRRSTAFQLQRRVVFADHDLNQSKVLHEITQSKSKFSLSEWQKLVKHE